MKSDNRMPLNEGTNQTDGVHASHDYNNEITNGSVGLENGGDNGASTLRLLRKKHNGTTADKKTSPKKPML